MNASGAIPTVRFVAWMGSFTGKFVEVVWPATTTLPVLSTAIAPNESSAFENPFSLSVPPRYVEYTSVPEAESLMTNQSFRQRNGRRQPPPVTGQSAAKVGH